LNDNPYSAPKEPSTGSASDNSNSTRAIAVVLSVLVGAPVAGILAYLLFGFCHGIGSQVISDATYDKYASSMFKYGFAAAILPSLLCGLFNPRWPIIVLLSSHLLGVALGAVVVGSGFRWQYAMGTYFLIATLLPIVVSTGRQT